MPFELSWLVEKRVVSLKVWGKINISENKEMNARLSEIIHAGEAPVHLIVTLGDSLSVPLDISMLAKGSPVTDKMVGRSILVGASGMIRFLGQMVANVTHADVRLVDTLEEAYQALRETDSSLPLEYAQPPA